MTEKKIATPDLERGAVTDLATQVVSGVTTVGIVAGAKHLHDKLKESGSKKK